MILLPPRPLALVIAPKIVESKNSLASHRAHQPSLHARSLPKVDRLSRNKLGKLLWANLLKAVWRLRAQIWTTVRRTANTASTATTTLGPISQSTILGAVVLARGSIGQAVHHVGFSAGCKRKVICHNCRTTVWLELAPLSDRPAISRQ